MRITTMHAQYRKMLLDSSKLLLGARTCLRGAARRNLSLAAAAQQQGASPVRAGLTAITRHAAAQRSRVARVQATAQRRHAPAEILLARTMTIGRAPRKAEKHRIRQPLAARSSRSTQPHMLREARAAQQTQSRSQRASMLAQRRSHAAETTPPVSRFQVTGTGSQGGQHAQRQSPMQEEAESDPVMANQPSCASTAAAEEQHMPAAAAQAQAQDSSDVAQCADQGGPSMGSPSVPEQAQEQGSPHIANHPATPQSHHPAAAAAGAPQSSHAGEKQRQRRVLAPIQEPGRGEMSPATPAQHSRSSGCHSMHGNVSKGGPANTSTEAPTSVASQQPPLSHETPEPVPAVWDPLSTKENQHPTLPERPAQTKAARPASRLGRCPSDAPSSLSGEALPCTAEAQSACAPSIRTEQHPPSPGATGPATPAQASEDTFHPKRLKSQPAQKPDWREASPEEAHHWLMYKKVLHRRSGGGYAEYQTMTLALPEDKCKQQCPRYGRQTFLQVETKPEDDPSIPFMARLARHQRDRVIKCNGGIAPEAGHKDYKVFSKFCRFAEKHYPPHSCTPSPL